MCEVNWVHHFGPISSTIRSRRLVLLHLVGQKISIPRRLRGGEQPVPRKPVEKTFGFQAAAIPAQEMNNRAFGLRELRGREVDGVEDEDQLYSGPDPMPLVRTPPESCAWCESLPVGRCREE